MAHGLAAGEEERPCRVALPQALERVLEPRHLGQGLLAQRVRIAAAARDLGDEVSDTVSAHALAADVVYGRSAALELPRLEQREVHGRQRQHQEDDHERRDLRPKLAGGGNRAPGIGVLLHVRAS